MAPTNIKMGSVTSEYLDAPPAIKSPTATLGIPSPRDKHRGASMNIVNSHETTQLNDRGQNQAEIINIVTSSKMNPVQTPNPNEQKLQTNQDNLADLGSGTLIKDKSLAQ